MTDTNLHDLVREHPKMTYRIEGVEAYFTLPSSAVEEIADVLVPAIKRELIKDMIFDARDAETSLPDHFCVGGKLSLADWLTGYLYELAYPEAQP